MADDTLLNAYARCTREQMLCAWRRAPAAFANAPPVQVRINMHSYCIQWQAHKIEPIRLDVSKELIVFWYGSTSPRQLADITVGLTPTVDASQSWKDIDYDTRCLLFHAWHNTLQRMFETDGYVRLGRW
jgi:hypothetical protein